VRSTNRVAYIAPRRDTCLSTSNRYDVDPGSERFSVSENAADHVVHRICRGCSTARSPVVRHADLGCRRSSNWKLQGLGGRVRSAGTGLVALSPELSGLRRRQVRTEVGASSPYRMPHRSCLFGRKPLALRINYSLRRMMAIRPESYRLMRRAGRQGAQPANDDTRTLRIKLAPTTRVRKGPT
jgi:hypothetical protein